MPAAETNKRYVKTKVVSPWKNDVAIVDVFTPFIDIRERSYIVLDLGCLLLRSIWCCCTLLMESDLQMVNPSAGSNVIAASTTRRRVWRWWCHPLDLFCIMFCWSVVPSLDLSTPPDQLININSLSCGNFQLGLPAVSRQSEVKNKKDLLPT